MHCSELEGQLHQLSQTLGPWLIQKGWKITCAESCTGGLIAKAITDIAGSSAYFDFGFVTYSNQAKKTLLAVDAAAIEQEGAVSLAVVEQMAAGALKVAQADIALSVSGIAGPDGGSSDKPVGTVCFAWINRQGKQLSHRQVFVGDRQQVRLQAAIFALQTLIDQFLKNSLDTV